MLSSRRAILRLCSGSITISLAGCIQSDGAKKPKPEECREYQPPQPTPTAEGLKPKSYPPYPTDLSKKSVKQFADQYEKAYQHNQFLTDFIEGTDEIDIIGGATTVSRKSGDFIVGVSGELKTGNTNQTGTGTPAPFADLLFAAWYYLSEQFALRKGEKPSRFEESDPPDFENASPIVCEFV